MRVNTGNVAALVTEIQNDFLDTPGLTLTMSQAQKRFGVDEITCKAVLAALVDAKVLAGTPNFGYVRFFPSESSPGPWIPRGIATTDGRRRKRASRRSFRRLTIVGQASRQAPRRESSR